MTIGSGIQVTLSLFHHQFEMLHCWYNSWESLIERRRGMTYVLSFMQTGAGIQATLRFCLMNPNGLDDCKDV
jgi:hypothetical protein